MRADAFAAQFRRLDKRQAVVLYLLGPVGWALLFVVSRTSVLAWLILLGVYTMVSSLLGVILSFAPKIARNCAPLTRLGYLLTHVVFTGFVALVYWLAYQVWILGVSAR